MQQEKKFDFNQIIAFVLMGLLLFGVMYWNTPSDEELEKQKQELVQKEKQEKAKEQQNVQLRKTFFSL